MTPGIEKPFTAVLLSWRRPKNLLALVESLRRIPHIQEIFVWNNNPDVTLQLPEATVFQAPRNFHCLARYCLVPLARFDNNIGQRNVAPVAGGGGLTGLSSAYSIRSFSLEQDLWSPMEEPLKNRILSLINDKEWKRFKQLIEKETSSMGEYWQFLALQEAYEKIYTVPKK